MICIYCLHNKTLTPNSRPHKKSAQVWRRRRCPSCGKTFTTYERPSLEDIVVATGNTKEQFSLGRLTISIYESMSSMPAAKTVSYELARTVEHAMIRRYDISSPITPSAIADETYTVLKHYDELCGLQYGARHGLIASIRRRGRPSTIATNADDVPGRE